MYCMSWNVLISCRVFDNVGSDALARLRAAGCHLEMSTPLGPFSVDSLLKKLQGIDAVLASPDAFTAQVLESKAAEQLKIISRWGVGYDSIDIAAATRQGIVVAYTPGLLNEAVADWAFALLLGIARRVHLGHESVVSGAWTSHWGHDIHGKTLGIVGFGRIGRAVAKRASGFNMKVLAHDSTLGPDSDGAEFVGLDELFERSDFVSLHVALNDGTRGLIGAEQLRRMKPNAYLINTARGPVVDEVALAKCLRAGEIAGAALDVFSKEPLSADSPLRGAPNLLMTPHMASFARETGEAVCAAAADAIIDLKNGHRPRWVVDPSVFESSVLRTTVAKS
ncbi:MAG: hydroxyacid dehydrogenase [Pedosphaera sp.]|nr:hydroxyacid dehydrogenase [Pedosphaera sp.]